MDIGVFLFCLIWIVLCGLLGFFIGDMRAMLLLVHCSAFFLAPLGFSFSPCCHRPRQRNARSA